MIHEFFLASSMIKYYLKTATVVSLDKTIFLYDRIQQFLIHKTKVFHSKERRKKLTRNSCLIIESHRIKAESLLGRKKSKVQALPK